MKREANSTTTRVLLSIFCGELITLLTGVIDNTPPMLVGATHHGYPFAWLFRLVLAPEYNPWRIDLLNFVADIIVWSVIVAIVVFVVARVRRPAGQ